MQTPLFLAVALLLLGAAHCSLVLPSPGSCAGPGSPTSAPPAPTSNPPLSSVTSSSSSPVSVQAFAAQGAPTDGSYAIGSIYPFTALNAGFATPYFVYADAASGSDANSGASEAAAVQTLAAAQALERALLVAHPAASVIVFLNGTFYLTGTLRFDQRDSAASPSFVVWTSLNPAAPAALSGGWVLPSAWTLYDPTLNIWALNVGGQVVRNIWVNGARPAKARNAGWPYQHVPLAAGPLLQLLSPIDCSSCSLPATSLATYSVEAVFLDEWQVSRCPAVVTSSNSRLSLTSAAPCGETYYDGLQTPGSTTTSGTITWLEDALPFLTLRNTWVSNHNDGSASSGSIYLIPSSPSFSINAARVVAGNLTRLVQVSGAQNLVFSSLVFEHSDWLNVSVAGMTVNQADVLWLYSSTVMEGSAGGVDALVQQYAASPGALIVPTAVHCYNCTNTVFMHNTFRHLGTGAMRYAEYSANNLFWHNEVQDVSASAVQVGTFYLSTQTVSRTVLQDNAFLEVAVEHYSSAAAFELWAQNTTYDHNTFWGAAYTAISVGLGWDFDVLPNSGNSTVSANDIGGIMQVAADGGGVYTNAAQATTTITANVIHALTSQYLPGVQGYGNYFCIYIDNGSQNVTIVGDNLFYDNYQATTSFDYTGAAQGDVVLPTSSSLNVTAVVLNSGTRLPLLNRAQRYYAFGGFFDDYFSNALSSTAGSPCPLDYVYHMVQTGNSFNDELNACYKVVSDPLQRAFVFGGMYGATVPNPYTGQFGCPAGFAAVALQQYQGSNGGYVPINYCYANQTAALLATAAYQFGGFYGSGPVLRLDSQVQTLGVGVVPYRNILTFQASCPAGFVAVQVDPRLTMRYCIPSSVVAVPVMSSSAVSPYSVSSSSSVTSTPTSAPVANPLPSSYIVAGQPSDFEYPQVAPSGYSYHVPLNGTFQPWDFSNGAELSGMARAGSPYGAAGSVGPPGGSQYGLIQPSTDQPYTVSTYVVGWQPGMVLTFYYAERAGDQTASMTAQAIWDGSHVVWTSPSPISATTGWTEVVTSALPTPSAAYPLLSFVVTPAQTGDQTFLFDAVLVTASPYTPAYAGQAFDPTQVAGMMNLQSDLVDMVSGQPAANDGSNLQNTAGGQFENTPPRGNAYTVNNDAYGVVSTSAAALGPTFTMSFWFQVQSVIDFQQTNLVSSLQLYQASSYWVSITEHTNILQFGLGTAAESGVSLASWGIGPTIVGVWSHVAVSYNYGSTEAWLYINGTLVLHQPTTTAATAWTGGTTTDTMMLGGGYSSVDYSFQGALQCLKWSSVNWSPREVTYVYLQEANGVCTGLANYNPTVAVASVSPSAYTNRSVVAGRVDLQSSYFEAVSSILGTGGTSPEAQFVTAAPVGYYWQTDGSNYEQINVPAAATPVGASFSISVWINPSTINGGGATNNYVFSTSTLSAATTVWVLITPSYQVQFGCGSGSTPLASYTVGSQLLNVWTHVAVAYNAATNEARLYLNGLIAVDSTSVTPTAWAGGSTSNPILLGNGYNGLTYAFEGFLRCVKWSTVAWTVAMIVTVYNNELNTGYCDGMATSVVV
jgi:hypothetical protein